MVKLNFVYFYNIIVEKNQEKYKPLPILKPIFFKEEFVNKLNGEQLHSNGVLIIADDEEYFFFVSCFNKPNLTIADNPDIIMVNNNDGITDEGETKEIVGISAVDVSRMFKMSFKDFYKNLKTQEEELEAIPYLGIKNQLQLVDRIGEKINSEDQKPKLVLIVKGDKKKFKNASL